MSFALPGFGQMHNGEMNKGLWVFLIFCASLLALTALVPLMVSEPLQPAALAASLAVAAGAWIYGIVEAMWRHWRSPVPPLRWQTIPVYAAVFLFAYLAVFKAGFGYVRAHLVEPFRIPSESMAPGIVRGDFLFADKRVNCPGCRRGLTHGDVVLFIFPDNRNMVFIKRIVGMPGDTIEIDGAEVSRNGKSLTARVSELPDGGVEVTEKGAHGEYAVRWANAGGGSRTFEVPHGHVFVMGDNRSRSRDSRVVGSIPLADVIGIAGSVWLSLDRNLDVRWDRMGRRVR